MRQVWPQPPQFCSSVPSTTQRPLQKLSPGAQTQAVPLQVWPGAHTWQDGPQWVGSERLTQLPPHWPSGEGQLQLLIWQV